MKKNKNNKTICLAAAALLLAGSLSVGSALAYFTAYDEAAGALTLNREFTQTEPNENVVDGKKEVTITNTGDFECYVRMKALTGNKYKDSIQYFGDSKWTPGADGYFYYSDIVPAGGKTSQIDVTFSFPTEEEPDDFNVIIIQECTPVLYNEDGSAYADWNAVADVTQTEYK